MSGIDDDRTLRRGQQRLLLHAGKEADPAWDTTTPSEILGHQDEMGRLEEVPLGRLARTLESRTDSFSS